MSAHRTAEGVEERLQPVLQVVLKHATVADRFVDRNAYRILVCTLWANVVLNPADAGLEEADLEAVHDRVNAEIAGVLGPEQTLRSCFEFLNGRAGERAMNEARLTPEHRDLLLFFASMILDPDGHRRWADELRRRQRGDG
jgi:hypothetical protein